MNCSEHKPDELPEDFDDDFEEIEFIRCSRCDGHDACEDFGCAIAAGLGRMVQKNFPPGVDDWS